tara:strand:- start:1126 stop:3408 length:2283 start_codon:yes stop_codon:yes gene_type:complete
MIKLKDILTEVESFKAKSKETGRTVVYKSKEAMEKAIEGGKVEPLASKKDKSGEKEKVKGADLFKTKETDKIKRPKIDMDKVFQKGRREKRTTDAPLKQAPKSVALKKGLPSDLKQSMSKISSQADLEKVFPNVELIQDTKETHQFFKLGMESEGRGGKKYPIYAKAYINRKTGEIKMSHVYSGKARDFGGGFTQGSDNIHGRDAESVLKDKPKAEPKSKYGAKQKGIGAGEKNLKGPQSDAGAIGGSAKAEQKVLKQLRAIGPKDNVDLCSVTVPGTNMFCAGNKGIPRAEMPQLKSTVVSGGKADKLVKAGKLEADAKTGEVNTEGMFKSMLEKEGISMSEPKPVLVSKLKATQNQLEGSKVNMFAKVLAGEQPFPDKKLPREALKKWQNALREPIIVSKEGYILDGHHRWAALVQHDVANGGGGDIEMDVKQVDMEAQALVDKTNKFTTDMGLAVKVKKPKKESFESRMLSKINEISIKINEQNPALVEPDGTIKGGPKKDDEEIKEAGFKNLSPFEHKLRLALKDEEKVASKSDDKQGYHKYIQELRKIQLVKVLGRGKLKSSEEKTYKQILKKYKLKEGKLNESTIGLKIGTPSKERNKLLHALDVAKVLYRLQTLSKTLSVLTIDKKYFKTAKKIIDAMKLGVMLAKEVKIKTINEFTGKPIPMDTPNEFGYLSFKKWAYKHRGQYKKDIQAASDRPGKAFEAASSWWMKWAMKKNRAYTHIKDRQKFGRALIIMMRDDGLVFDKSGNRITKLK